MTAHLPVELTRLWRLTAESRLGRPAQLDVDQVVHAAVALADNHGLTGVTLPKVASTLGVTKMSLYRHVGSKAELLDLMADYAQGPPPDIAAGDWRTGLREWAKATAQVLGSRYWLTDIPVTGPPAGPNAIAWFDMALRQLRDTGLDFGAKTGIVQVISWHVRGWVQLHQGFQTRQRDTGIGQAQVEREYGQHMATLIDPERFPDAGALITSGMFETLPATDEDSAHSDWEFGLELILDGIAGAIARLEAAYRSDLPAGGVVVVASADALNPPSPCQPPNQPL